MKVMYQWTEDGTPELCAVYRITTDKDTVCYHCSQIIPAGQAAALLRTVDDEYLIHRECVLQGCTERYAQRVSNYLKEE